MGILLYSCSQKIYLGKNKLPLPMRCHRKTDKRGTFDTDLSSIKMTSLILLTTLVVLLTASVSPVFSYCPQKCYCYTESVSCHGTTDFDKNFFSSKGKITLWDFHINILPDGIFSNVGQELFHTSQRSIHIYRSNIGTIEGGAFKNLQNLESVLFANVNISRIKTGAFENITNIGSFSLLESNIGIIDHNAFGNFLKISDFTISNTRIESISENAFYNFHDISIFGVSLAKIKTIGSNSFSSFQGISRFELSWNKFESLGCSSLIQAAQASKTSIFTHNGFPCDCNLYWLMGTLPLSSLENSNYCIQADGKLVSLNKIEVEKNSLLRECATCHSITYTSVSSSVTIPITDTAFNGSAPTEGTTKGGLHTNKNTNYTTSTEPSGALFATLNMSITLVASSTRDKMSTATTTTTPTKHGETSEKQSSNAICSGNCSTINSTSICNTETTTNFVSPAKDVTEENGTVTDINISTLEMSSELILTGFPTSSPTALLSRQTTTFLPTRSPTSLSPTSSSTALSPTSSPTSSSTTSPPTSSSTTSPPISSSTTSSPTSLPTKPKVVSDKHSDKFTTEYGNEFGLYNRTLSKVSPSSSSKTASALFSTTFRAISSKSSSLPTKTALVAAAAATTTTNVSVLSSSSRRTVVTMSLSSSVESSTKSFSATQNSKFFGSIAATEPARDSDLDKTSSSSSSSSTDRVYPKISFPIWTDATRVSKRTTEVTNESITGFTSGTNVNGAFHVTITFILAVSLTLTEL